MDGDSLSAKRRHSRPLELDSEGEEEMDTSEKEEEEEEESEREEEPGEKKDIDRLSSVKVRPVKEPTWLQVKKVEKLCF